MILKRAVSCMLVILLLGCLLIPVCADELPEDLSVTNGCHGIVHRIIDRKCYIRIFI